MYEIFEFGHSKETDVEYIRCSLEDYEIYSRDRSNKTGDVCCYGACKGHIKEDGKRVRFI